MVLLKQTAVGGEGRDNKYAGLIRAVQNQILLVMREGFPHFHVPAGILGRFEEVSAHNGDYSSDDYYCVQIWPQVPILKLSRIEPDQYLDERPPGKTMLLEEVLVRPAGGAYTVFCVVPNAPVY